MVRSKYLIVYFWVLFRNILENTTINQVMFYGTYEKSRMKKTSILILIYVTKIKQQQKIMIDDFVIKHQKIS